MKKKKKHIILYIFIILAALAIIAALLIKNTVFAEYEYETTRVEIHADASGSDVENALTDALGNSFGKKAALLWQLQGGKPGLAHGSYEVRPGMTAIKVARNIAKGNQTPVRFTFNNMRLISELASRAASLLEFDSTAFMGVADSVLPAQGFTKAQYQAAFLPDTYEFYWTTSPEKVIHTLAGYRSKFWNEERKAKAKALGLSPEEVHTIASIVEEETNKRDEQPKVARLYINRLEKGMELQSDPTLKFASGNFAARRITGPLLKTESPYNTYRNKGLPPGPIRIAEAATLDAVLSAPKHNYLYMCAKADFSGYHEFATDYARHRINAARYHRALDARGIR